MKSQLSQVRLILVIFGITLMAMLGERAFTQGDPQANSANSPYRAVEGWGKTLPDGRQWGSDSAIATDSKGNVWTAERCGGSSCADSKVDPIIEFDTSGKVIKSIGAGLFVVPHNIYIDKSGNLWVTDNAVKDGKGGQVIELSPDGKVLMTLGKAGVAGEAPDAFDQPNGIAIAANGDIFVAEGHAIGKGSATVLKFTKDGKFIKQWGEHGSGPGQFEVPHAVSIDSKGRVFIADRGNRRIQIFDQDGKFLEQWAQFGIPSGVFIDRRDMLYVADSMSQSEDPKLPTYNPGFEQGIRIGSAKNARVTAFIPIPPPAGVLTNAPEGVAADASGNVYGADVFLKDVRKFVKE